MKEEKKRGKWCTGDCRSRIRLFFLTCLIYPIQMLIKNITPSGCH